MRYVCLFVEPGSMQGCTSNAAHSVAYIAGGLNDGASAAMQGDGCVLHIPQPAGGRVVQSIAYAKHCQHHMSTIQHQWWSDSTKQLMSCILCRLLTS
jgi:hypothetical protein